MLSKNNVKEYIEKNAPTKQRFTIKKLTVGVASVLIGMTFAGTSVASADETPASSGAADNNTSSQTGSESLVNASQAPLKTSAANSAASTAQSGDQSTADVSANAGSQSTATSVAASAATSAGSQTTTFTPQSASAAATPQTYGASLAVQSNANVTWPNSGKNNRLTQDRLEAVKNASLQDSQNKINNRYNEEQSTEQTAANQTKPQTPAAVHNSQEVSSWADLQAKLADSGVDEIRINGNITADTPLYTGGTANAARTNTFAQNSQDWNGLAVAENKAQIGRAHV